MALAKDSTVARDVTRAFDLIEVYGHSWTTPAGVVQAASWWAMLAHALGVGAIRRGIDGTRITQANNGQGGWDRILNSHTRGATGTALPRLAILMHGLNDAGFGVTTAQFLAVMRTCIRRLQASAVVEETDPSITYTGTWTPVTSNACSGGAYTFAAATNAGLSFTVPSWVPAGSVLVLRSTHDTAATTPFAASNGGTYSVTKNGAAQTAWTINAAGSLSTTIMPDSYELTVNPGDTIALSVTAVTSQIRFDGYDIVPPTPQRVLVALPGRSRPGGAATYASANPALTQTSFAAAVVDYNTQLAALCATLGVKTFDLERALNREVELFRADQLHPNAQAQPGMARQALEALGLTARREIGAPAPYGEDMYQQAQVTRTASLALAPGSVGSNISGFGKVRQSTWMFYVTAISATGVVFRIVGYNFYDAVWFTVATSQTITAVGRYTVTVPGGTPDVLGVELDLTGTSVTYDVIETHQTVGC